MTTNASLLPVSINQTALALAETMFGEGITLLSASYQGDSRSAGIYSDGSTLAPGVVPSDEGVILSTGLAQNFTNATGEANQVADRSTDTTGANGLSYMNAIAGVATYDAAVFEASFTSTGDELSMRLVFASEEYLEWVNSGFNDAVGIWVNGQKVELALGSGDVSIDNINTTSNANLFLDNTQDALNTEMDGLTRVLTLKADLLVGGVNTIRIAIADAGDPAYDSALLIVADSVQSALIARDDALSVTGYGHLRADLLANDQTTGRAGVQISHINDVAVTAGDVVVLASGDSVRLESDGQVTVLSSGLNGDVTFSYTITDAAGVSDLAFVTVSPQAVDGTDGNDSMLVNFRDAQGNQIDGADGMAEAIFGYGGNDKIFAGQGDDRIYGGTGNDFTRAGAGNDLIIGGDGADVLDGEAGADTMDGGLGNDVYYIDSEGDVIIEAAGAGYDKVHSALSHSLGATFEELWLREGSQASFGAGNALANKIIGNALANRLEGNAGADNIIAGQGADSVYGGADADNLYGGAGADQLFGEDGADKLFGGAGSDALYGGAGNDRMAAGADGAWMDGGAGNDILGAGTGADVFHFAAGCGVDVIRRFDAAEDRIAFLGIDEDSLQVSVMGTRTILSWGTADKVSVIGWQADIAGGVLPFDFL